MGKVTQLHLFVYLSLYIKTVVLLHFFMIFLSKILMLYFPTLSQNLMLA